MRVIVNSLPKSGTNLIGKMLDIIDFKQYKFIGAQKFLGRDLRNIYHRIQGLTRNNGFLVGIDTPVKIKGSYLEKTFDGCNDMQYIITHVGYTDEFLSTILDKGFKPILIYRDPRAVLNSFVNYVVNSPKHPVHKTIINLEQVERYKFALEGGLVNQNIYLQSLLTRCYGIENWRNNEMVFSLKFEDLIGPDGGGDLIKQRITLSQLFEFLKVGQEKIEVVQENLFGVGRHTFRKGKIDSWNEEIPSELLPVINKRLSPILKSWGYE